MSHSRKSVNVTENVLLLQQDLKKYSRSKLLTLANYYQIPTTLNRERLTMEIAKANLKRAKHNKARQPSGVELAEFSPKTSNTSLNRQVLTAAQHDCTTRLDEVQQLVEEKLRKIRNKREELYKALEKGLEAAPEAFNEILPQVLGTCKQELDAVHDCLVTAVTATETGADEKLQAVEAFLAQLSGEEAPASAATTTATSPGLFPGTVSPLEFPAPGVQPLPSGEPLFESGGVSPGTLLGQHQPTTVVSAPGAPEPTAESPAETPETPETAYASAVTHHSPEPSDDEGSDDDSPEAVASAPSQVAAPQQPLKPYAASAPSQVVAPQQPLKPYASAPPIGGPAQAEEQGVVIDPLSSASSMVAHGTPPESAQFPVSPAESELGIFGSAPAAAVAPVEQEFEEVTLGSLLCDTDEDCEALEAAGKLSGTLKGQKVICVNKRNGTPDCVYQA